jgi:hypothetical protein
MKVRMLSGSLCFVFLHAGHAKGTESPRAFGEAHVTQAMLDHAAEVGKRMSGRQAVVSSERKLFGEDLSKDCHDGNLDACYMMLELMPTPLLPGKSRDPDAAYKRESEHLDALLGLCMKQHPAACISLGTAAWLAYLDSKRQPSRPLVELVRSVTKSAPIVERQRLEAIARRESARQNFEIPVKVLRQYSKACVNGKGYACFAGEMARWDPHGNLDDPKVGAEYNEMVVRKWRVHFKVSTSIYSRYSSKYPSLDENSLAGSFNLGLISLDEYIHKLDAICAAGNASGCYMKGVKQSYVEQNDDIWRSYERACELGFMGGCMQMAEHFLSAGEVQKALLFAVSACQKGWAGSCSDLVAKFGRSSEYAALSTAKFLVNYACEREDASGCMQSNQFAFKEGKLDEARRGFGQLCENQRNFQACRFAAQVAWSSGHPNDALALLDKGCLYRDKDSCLEKAAAHAAKGERGIAGGILDSFCGEAVPDANSYACRLASLVRKGFVPNRLDEIFTEPLDGSENVLFSKSK